MNKTILVLMIFATAFALIGSSTCIAATGTLMEEAQEAFADADYPKAVESYERILAESRSSGDKKATVECLIRLGRVYLQMGRYGRALELLEEAHKMSVELKWGGYAATSLTVAGKVHRNLGQYDKALECHRRALTIRKSVNNDKIGEDLLSMGTINRFLGQYPRAIKNLEKALQVFRRNNARKFEATALSEIGAVYRLMGHPEKALTYHEQALAISRELKNRFQEQYDLLYIGLAHLPLGQTPKAIQYFEQSLSIARAIQNPKGEAVSLLNMADALIRMKRFDKAREAVSRCREIFSELGEVEFIWRTDLCLGRISSGQGRHEEALLHYERAVDTIESLRSSLTEEGARGTYMQSKMRVYDEFVGLLLILHGKDPSKGYDRRSFEIFERKQGRSFLEAMGKSGAKHFAWLPQQLRDRERELEEELAECRQSLGEEQSRPPGQTRKGEIDVLSKRIGHLKGALKALETEMERDFPDYHALRHPKPASVAELQEKVLRPGEFILVYGVLDKETVLWSLSHEHFELFSIPVNENDLAHKVHDFREGLRVVLEAVQKRQPEFVIRRIIQDSMEGLLAQGRVLHDLLIPQGAQKKVSKAEILYVVPSGSLYVLPFETLIPPQTAKDEKPRFLIESHPVAYLSSASLLKTLRESAGRKREKPRYPLIAFANPVYRGKGDAADGKVPSPTQPQEPTRSDEDASEMSVRSLTFMELMGGAFVELPETEDEAKEIMNLLDAPRGSQPLQLRDAASRTNIMRMNEADRLKDYRYLVFSCHGILPEEVDSVRQPSLVLSHPDPQNKGDGFLTMADVFKLRLNADFVSLSACNTGMGKIVRGEGVIGLTRAFMYAGTPALMVNLWSVESQSAKLLNTGFYRNLKEGTHRAEALRRSKLHLIQGEEGDHLRHPFFWAPSVIFGDGS